MTSSTEGQFFASMKNLLGDITGTQYLRALAMYVLLRGYKNATVPCAQLDGTECLLMWRSTHSTFTIYIDEYGGFEWQDHDRANNVVRVSAESLADGPMTEILSAFDQYLERLPPETNLHT